MKTKKSSEKRRQNKTDRVLPFRARPGPAEEKPTGSTAYFQIGSTRFAIHIWYESLPSLPPQPVSDVKKKTNLVLLPEGSARTGVVSKPQNDGNVWKRKESGPSN
jgi:hypothetical protein